tara:strand:- start:11144 stop:11743 length:600 start_codon:yes stop_codon:yes gene_type:complete
MIKRPLLAGTLFTLVKVALFSVFAFSYKVNAAELSIDENGYLHLDGTITFEDTSVISNFIHKNRFFPKVLVVRSNGGIVSSAMFIGNLVNEVNGVVIVGKYCNSACPMILFSSKYPYVYEGAKVGVHAPSNKRTGVRTYEGLYSDSYWKAYGLFRASGMEEKKVLELLEIIYSQHTAYMRYFTEEELKYFGVKILKRKK